jgi:GABA(A) receptor-associated protein
MADFKSRTTLSARIAESERIRQRFPGRVPIIVEKASRAADVPSLPKCKFLAPEHMNVGQFIYVIRKNLSLPPEKALFLFVGDILPTTATLMSELHFYHKDPHDGFLYMKYSSESTFG